MFSRITLYGQGYYTLRGIYIYIYIYAYIPIGDIEVSLVFIVHDQNAIRKLHLISKCSDVKYSFFECWSFTCRKQVLYLVIFDRITAHLEMNLGMNSFIKYCKYPSVSTCIGICPHAALWFWGECITDKIWYEMHQCIDQLETSTW